MGFELTELGIVFGCLLPGLHAAYTDIKKGIISDVVTLLIFLAGLAFAVITRSYINAFIGSALGFFSFFIVAWITNGSVGGGDIKLAAGIGMWFGYVQTIEVIVIACLITILFEFILYWRAGTFKKLFIDRLGPYAKKVLLRFGYRINTVDLAINAKYPSIPFGPFLVFSSWFVWIINYFI